MNAIALPDPSELLRRTMRSDFHNTQSSGHGLESRGPLRILLVDDEPAIVEVVEIFLAQEGHTVEAASDGGSGLDRFREGGWDLIIVDCRMPGMNGIELAAAIKDRDPNAPIMMMTGSAEFSEEGECRLAHVDAVVRKPFSRASLVAGIGRVLGKFAR